MDRIDSTIQTHQVLQSQKVQNDVDGNFKSIFDKLLNDATCALKSKDYLELMKIAVSIKAKANMIKNSSLGCKNDLLRLATSIEKSAKELMVKGS